MDFVAASFGVVLGVKQGVSVEGNDGNPIENVEVQDHVKGHLDCFPKVIALLDLAVEGRLDFELPVDRVRVGNCQLQDLV